jgi:hypothetical protein
MGMVIKKYKNWGVRISINIKDMEKFKVVEL